MAPLMTSNTISASSLSCPKIQTPDFVQRRRRTLASTRCNDESIEALIFCDPLDIHYLTGSGHGISWLAVRDGVSFAVSRHMLVSEVRTEAVECEVLLATASSTDRVDMEEFVVSQLINRGLKKAAIDPTKISAQSFLRIKQHAEHAGLDLRVLPGCFSGIRALKDEGELAITRHCVRIAEQALSELLARGAAGLIGRTERDIANELESRMWALGADRQGFPETGIIVASGPNSASPHHTPSQRRIAAGEALLFDWGAELAGYRSDLTRTVFPISVPEFAQQAYPVVEQALLRAAAVLGDGVTMGEVDLAARQTVVDAGYTEFHYGVGHGVGLAIHEEPWLRANSTELCIAEMITTIEPGIYLEGIGGIRIENLYRVTKDGNECLASLPTDLESMILA